MNADQQTFIVIVLVVLASFSLAATFLSVVLFDAKHRVPVWPAVFAVFALAACVALYLALGIEPTKVSAR